MLFEKENGSLDIGGRLEYQQATTSAILMSVNSKKAFKPKDFIEHLQTPEIFGVDDDWDKTI